MTDHPCPEITHLICDVPAFQTDGTFRGIGDLNKLLSMIPQDICIIGGRLEQPCLVGYKKADLLSDPIYLASNAEITADCVLRLASGKLDRTFSDAPALIIGWGRIGKFLHRKLAAAGCPVTIAARNVHDRAILEAAGTNTISIEDLPEESRRFHLIFNTAPAALPDIKPNDHTLLWELSSCSGIRHPKVIAARGLPGSMAPYSSGKLIAQTIVRLLKEERI